MNFGFVHHFTESHGLNYIDSMYGDICRANPAHAGIIQHYDAVVAQLGSKGIKTILHLGYGNRSIDDWVNQTVFWTYRYKDNPNVIAFEMGNEPNMAHFNSGKPYTPEEAARYTRTSYAAARDTGWNKPLITAGPARIGGREAWRKYLKDMFAAGIPDECDLAGHPYPEPNMQYLDSIDYQIQEFRRVLKNRSGHRRYWATETGLGTGPNQFSEAEQASRLTNIVKMCRKKELEGLTIFRYRDGGVAETNPYRWYGVCKGDYSPKTAYHELKKVA